MATWLVNFRDGDVRCRDELPSLVDLGGDNERDPFRVMLAYETQFKRQIAEQVARGDKPADIAAAKQLALLFLMGLFDRPMERGDREALLAEPVIPGLSGLVAPRPTIDYAVQSLRDLGLLLPRDKDTPDDLDAHPLVREYFGARLEKEQPEAWQAAHGRLYDYYRFRGLPEAFREPVAYGQWLRSRLAMPDISTCCWKRVAQRHPLRGSIEFRSPHQSPGPRFPKLRAAAKLIDGPEWDAALAGFLPESEEAMAPLFAAIAHGCAAGRHNEAFIEVSWPRIARGNESFATKQARPLRLGPRGHRPFLRRAVRRAGAPALARAIRPWCSTWRVSACARSGASPRRWSRCGSERSSRRIKRIGKTRHLGIATSPSCW